MRILDNWGGCWYNEGDKEAIDQSLGERNNMSKKHCLRCNSEMNYYSKEKMQLGQTGWVLGDLPNLFAGSLEVEIYICPKCRKLEFFLPENVEIEEPLPQKECPNCGKTHDFDYPKCPFCKYDYNGNR